MVYCFQMNSKKVLFRVENSSLVMYQCTFTMYKGSMVKPALEVEGYTPLGQAINALKETISG